jgi:hypothetical protein
MISRVLGPIANAKSEEAKGGDLILQDDVKEEAYDSEDADDYSDDFEQIMEDVAKT